MEVDDRQDQPIVGESVSAPLELEVEEEGFKQKNRKGLVKKFKCQYCPATYRVHRNRAILHKKRCKKRADFKSMQQQTGQEEEYYRSEMRQMQKQRMRRDTREPGGEDMTTIREELDILKSQISIVLNRVGQNYFQNDKVAEVVVEEVWRDVSLIVIPLIKEKLKQQVSAAIANKLEIQPMIACLRSNLISRFYEFDFKDLLQSWSHKFDDACKELVEGSKSKVAETRSRERTSVQQLQSYSEFELTISHRRFVQQLKSFTTYKRSTIIRFYNKLLRGFPSLNLKVLPRNLPIYVFSMQRKIIDLETIKRKVIELWNEGRQQLACDIYFCVGVGLRRSELEKIYLSDAQRHLYRYIKVFQRKNKNETVRPVPMILHLLSHLSQTTYPITSYRFCLARQFCLRQFTQFYGLRHVCITNLIGALLSQSDLAIHRRTQTTISRYLNVETVELVDRTFNIPQFQARMDNFTFEIARQYPFFRANGTVQMQELKQKEEVHLLEDNDEDFINDDNYDNILSNSIDRDYRSSHLISEEYKQQIQLRGRVFTTYHQELEDQDYTPVGVINQIISSSNLSCQQINDQQDEICQLPTLQSKLKIISEMLNIKIDSLSSEELISSTTSSPMMVEVRGEDVLVIGEISNNFYLSQSVSLLSKKYSQGGMSLRPRKKNIDSDYLLSAGDAYCCNCFRFLDSYRKGNHCFLKCTSCRFTTEKYGVMKIASESLKSQLNITCIGGPNFSNIQHSSIERTAQLNNLARIVKRDFGKNFYSYQMHYSTEVPEMMTKMICHSMLTTRQIEYNQKNEQYLPLTIQTSNIEGAGLGMFATANLPANSIIITYCGVVRTNKSINPDNNSLFQIGFADPSDDREPLALFLEPSPRSNSGRYINHSNHLPNSTPSLGLAINQSGDCNISLYVYSSREIAAGQEILYDYGKNYTQKLFRPMEE